MKLLVVVGIFMINSLAHVNAYPYPSTDDNELDSGDDAIDLSQYGAKIFGTPDNETGKLVAEYNPETDDVNPEELGNYLEGDMLMPPQLQGQGRNGLSTASSRWPGGVVPFEINGNFNAYQMSLIEQAINEYHRRTCLRFTPRTYERDYLSFVSGNSGCWSSVGRVGGRQEINLQSPGCTSKVGTIIHEMMHAVGFLHEQNRSDRDNYISVNWNNIRSGTQANFDKASAASTNAFGVEYDYGSVMHYSANAFSKNGQATIIPKRNTNSRLMGQRDGFSYSDVSKINKMYQCANNNRRQLDLNNKQQLQLNNGGFSQFSSRFDDSSVYSSLNFWQQLINSWLNPQRQSNSGGYGFY